MSTATAASSNKSASKAVSSAASKSEAKLSNAFGSKRELIKKILTENPAATFAEVDEIVRKAGFEKFGSSEFSSVRVAIGLSPGGKKRGIAPRELSLADVESISNLPAALGVSVKEAIQICEHVDSHSQRLGGTARLVEALKVLGKFTGQKV